MHYLFSDKIDKVQSTCKSVVLSKRNQKYQRVYKNISSGRNPSTFVYKHIKDYKVKN